jgi:hypothetical protein
LTKDVPVFDRGGLSANSRAKLTSPDSHFGSKPDENEYRPKALPRSGDPSINLVSDYIRPRRLSASEEADLIKRAQDGDKAAANELVKAHILYVRWKATEKWRELNRKTGLASPLPDRAIEYADFVTAGLVALSKAIRNWRPGNKLNAFARRGIAGAMADTVRDWRNKPALAGMDARIQRFIRSHPYWSREWLANLFAQKYNVHVSLKHVAEEQHANHAAWTTETYSEGADWVGDDYERPVDLDAIRGDKPLMAATQFDDGEANPMSEWSRWHARNWWRSDRGADGLRTSHNEDAAPPAMLKIDKRWMCKAAENIEVYRRKRWDVPTLRAKLDAEKADRRWAIQALLEEMDHTIELHRPTRTKRKAAT